MVYWQVQYITDIICHYFVNRPMSMTYHFSSHPNIYAEAEIVIINVYNYITANYYTIFGILYKPLYIFAH